MADTFTKEKRSDIMKRVKSGRNLSTELELIKIFKRHQIKGWRRNYKLFGKPDFVFRMRKIAVFADGCFWHGHDCRKDKPVANAEYWNKKIKKNMDRDHLVNNKLLEKGWTVIRFWECEISKNEYSIKLDILKELLF